jgi:putative DNA primase/helicase
MRGKPQSAENPLLRAALGYSRLGWRIHPLRGKIPVEESWPTVATSEEKTIRGWWNKNRSYNVGLSTGPESGDFVLDLDGPQGRQWLADMEAQHGPLPTTPVCQTGGGGLHYHFKYPSNGTKVFNSQKKIAPKVDVRGIGGNIVLPPSSHKSGNTYQWIEGKSPHDVALADPPPWLMEVITRQNNGSQDKGDPTVQDRSAVIREGEGRNDDLFRKCSSWIRKLTREETESLAFAWNTPEHYVPPLSDKEVLNAVNKSALRYRQQECGAELDSAIDQAAGTRSPEERAKAIDDALTIVCRQDPLVRQGLLQKIAKRCTDIPSAQLNTRLTEIAMEKFGELPTGSKFLPEPYCDRIMTDARIFFSAGRFWIYEAEDGIYRERDDLEIQRMIQILGNGKLRKNHIEDAFFALKLKGRVADGAVDRPGIVCLKNGYIDLLSSKPNLLPHTPDHLCTIQIPVRYNPDATCHKFQRFLARSVPEPELRKILQEMTGYCMVPDRSYQIAFIIPGRTSTGKSTFLSIFRELIGPANTTAFPLNKIGHEYNLGELPGKLVNIAGELDAQAYVEDGIVKRLVAGIDPVQGRRPYGRPFEFLPYVRLVTACNYLPLSKDVSKAFFRRFQMIPFDVQTLTDDPAFVKDLADEVIEKELDGVFLWALAGLARLRKRQAFTKSLSAQKALEDWQKDADPVREFADLYLAHASGERASLQTVFRAFDKWCDATNRKNNFLDSTVRKRLENHGFTFTRSNKGWTLRDHLVRPVLPEEGC